MADETAEVNAQTGIRVPDASEDAGVDDVMEEADENMEEADEDMDDVEESEEESEELLEDESDEELEELEVSWFVRVLTGSCL